MTLKAVAINQRYSALAESCCSLSCGGALALSDPRPGETRVDLGSGRGNDVIRMAEQVGPEGYAYGIDISEGMVEKARKNLEKFEIKNAEFLRSGFYEASLGFPIRGPGDLELRLYIMPTTRRMPFGRKSTGY